MIIPLSSLIIGMDGIIVRLDFEDSIKERFIAMGVLPGKKITYVHESPFGDPMVFKIEDNKIMIRKSEAQRIFVDVTEEYITLDEARPGMYEVFMIKGGMLLKKELEKTGITIGSKIQVLSNNYGKVLINANGKKIGFGKGRSRKIILRKIR
ncbi:hypothetical protein XO10_01245 [Marinitoga sp. 1135]|uniref:Fe2+ transport system protein A n=1 Tax=Marinitoga piezophila (strain DSM 14283 / JCM 11233 / KA3) TaxID=443254 RepID=H2J3J8_MARPK|nr:MULTISPECIES: FeoA family protein [Marinitoga]AEX84642.1 Fe2+ transport system protein A [Marinitoga piezophila KA3]APT75159.1 hypothetical protein LN42_01160 [Marinitoga sp. 1137]NUU94933.1 hypothetical protein [Marinitoga sp. 1135]NUU96886.1 hypothetical protein [Marinitoga sp. 1138]